MGFFTKLYLEDLPSRAKLVYFYLKDRADKEGMCYPSIKTIAKDLSISQSTAKRAIADLEKAGFLQKVQRWRPSGGRSSLLFLIEN